MKKKKLFNGQVNVTRHAMKNYLLRVKCFETEQYEYLMKGVNEENKAALIRYKHYKDELKRKIKSSVLSHISNEGEVRRETTGPIEERCVFALVHDNGKYFLKTVRLQGSKHDFFKVGV